VPDTGVFADDGPPIPGLVGGPGLADVRRRIATVSGSTAPVLIEGETGSGKEIVASAIHGMSGRSGEMTAVNCAAIASELVESELFGHARGSFSGSQGARAGLFRAADRGTLLLDEIGELEPAVQAKLLRVLETGEIRGVGEDRGVRVDVRVVAATHRNLSALVAAGAFRADLFHRIAALRIRVPPLSEHVEDIPRLAARFLEDQGVSLTAPALESLMQQAWPGNVRELRNAVIAAATTVRYDRRDAIAPADLPDPSSDAAQVADDEADVRARIIATLESCEGNVGRAATELGTSRSVLYETLRRLRIDPRAYRGR
jgi:transcriptional regulator with GAF, ATPase, and Fis domain